MSTPRAWAWVWVAGLMLTACGGGLDRGHAPPTFAEKTWELRPTDLAAMAPRYEAGETVESVVSPGGSFRIHFTRSGLNAIPAADSNGNGVPDFVESVGATYDAVLARYLELGFQKPLSDGALGQGANGGDEKFDVYLVDFGGRADGSFRLDACATPTQGCAGHMLQENDFSGYAYATREEGIRVLASHELFHAVQSSYNADLGTVAQEGTAVWASEAFDSSLQDLEAFSRAYFERTDRSLTLDPVGPVQEFAYGSAIFFEFLSQKFGDGIISALWSASQGSSSRWPVLLDARLRADHGSSFADAFREFSLWNVYTGSRADPSRSYPGGASYEEVPSTSLPLPANQNGIRVAFAASRHFDLPVPSATGELWAAFVPDDQTTHGLTVAVAALGENGKVLSLTTPAAGAGTQNLVRASVAGAASIRLIVIDDRLDGEGRFGRLCAGGTEAELSPCAVVATEPEPSPERTRKDDGGCQSASPGSARFSLLSLLAALAVLSARGGATRPPAAGAATRLPTLHWPSRSTGNRS